MLDPRKISEKINELNELFPSDSGGWHPADGLHALTKIDVVNDRLNFHPSTGVPIKVFVHSHTGEIKIFSARIFGLDK